MELLAFLERENNMAAVELEWIPETLYNTAISAVVDNYSRSRRDIRSLPENIQFDVYYKVRSSRRRDVSPVFLAAKLLMVTLQLTLSVGANLYVSGQRRSRLLVPMGTTLDLHLSV